MNDGIYIHIFSFVEPVVRWSFLEKNDYLFCFPRPMRSGDQQREISTTWELLEMQILRPHRRPTEPEMLGVAHSNLCSSMFSR